MDKNKKFGKIAIAKANRTEESLGGDAEALSDQVDTNKANITLIQSSLVSIGEDIIETNNKLDAIASLFGITFNADGTLANEIYTSHTHSYDDSGTTKSTGGIE